MEYHYDVAIIGSGPGGYVAAIRARQLGLTAAVIEKSEMGGVCLNWGCIPTKALINQAGIYNSLPGLEHMGVRTDTSGFNYEAVHQKSRAAAERLSKGVLFLLKKNKVDFIRGKATIAGPGTITIDHTDEITAKNIIIATGSRPKDLPGLTIDEERVLSSTGILKLTTLPTSIIILGAGAIGLECAYILNSFGVNVTIVEMLDSLFPQGDAEITKVVQRVFKKHSIETYVSAQMVDYQFKNGHCEVTLERKGNLSRISAEKILVAVGRSPNIDDIGIEHLGVECEKGFIRTGDYYKTTVDTVFAVGDVINTPLLAHVASREGETAVEYIAGQRPRPRITHDEIPYGIYCEPQVGGFGMTEKDAAAHHIPYGKAVFPYRSSGKAVALDNVEGMVKLIFHKDTKEILGTHIVGAEATELVHEALLAKTGGLKLKDMAQMLHGHPTLSEMLMEAARAGENRAIHL